MSESSVGVSPGTQASALQSLSERVEAFAAWLGTLGYEAWSFRAKVRSVAEFVQWMEAAGLSTDELDEALIDKAMEARHRPPPRGYRRALVQFLEYLRGQGLVAIPLEKLDGGSPSARLEERYVLYLREERGLSEATVVNYRGFVRRWLNELFGNSPTQLADLVPREVTQFLLRHVQTLHPKRAQLMGSALRSFLRFLFLRTETRVDLSLAIPSVRQFRKSTMPRHLTAKEVERVLASCDLTTPIGRRDHAVLLLLARLGLRASEIVKLELGDLRWRASELVVRGKGAIHDRLPLPQDVGEALTLYLTQDRPACLSRQVFLCLRAPRRGFASAAAVTTIVERAIERTGLQPALRGAHVLRHSLATRMIQHGATMAEIGQVLRHRSPKTTELYAKVDFEGLRGVSLPWPVKGGGR